MLNRLILVLSAGLLVLAGCGAEAEEKKEESQDEQAKEEETEKVLYEKGGLVVSNVSGWSVGKEKENPLTVTFNHQQMKAIATVVETDKNFNELKEEIIAGAGNVDVLEEQEGYFSYQSTNQESIRTDVYISHEEQQTLILSFLAKSDVYEKVKDAMNDFHSAVELQK